VKGKVGVEEGAFFVVAKNSNFLETKTSEMYNPGSHGLI
jgi:hypothetical protein